MTNLNVILSFAAAVAMALTTIDTVNAANLRSEKKFLTSIDIDSTKSERFLQEMEGGENPEDNGTQGGSRFPEEVEASENADDDSVDSTDTERFLVELNGAAAKEVQGSESPEADGTQGGSRFPEEVEASENADDDSVDSTDTERFLVELNGAAAKVSGRFNGERFLAEEKGVSGDSDDSTSDTDDRSTVGGERFLQEVQGSESPEADGTQGGSRFPEEVEASENADDDSVDSTDTERFLVELNGAAAKVSGRFNGERFLAEEKEVQGSESPEADGTQGGSRFPEEVEASENADDDSVDSTDTERFLVELNGAAAKVSGRFNGERFLQEVQGSESPEADGTQGGSRFPEEVEASENADDDSVDSTDTERFLVELNGAAAKVSGRFNGERFLAEEKGVSGDSDDSTSDTDDRSTVGGERFLQEVQGSESPEADGTQGGSRFPEEVEASENADDDSVDSTDTERFLVELNGAAAKVSGRFNGERFLQEVQGSESPEADGTQGGSRFPEEVEASENADDDSVDSTDTERFLVELNGAAAKVSGRFNGERFLQEVQGSESPEADGTQGGSRFPEEVEASENADDDSVDSTDTERFLVELNGAAAKVSGRFNGERFLQEVQGSESPEADGTQGGSRFPEEVEASENADDDSVDSTDTERFLVELNGAAAKVSGRFNGERFLAEEKEVQGSESPEADGTQGGSRFPEEVEASEDAEDDSRDIPEIAPSNGSM
ncbi:unnamed protein product [Peronospora farinosa]|uniref:Uncharacterized protein n=1 Tax=Peronospora farinosa TaxID=134698 RepID=A0ABN8C5A1_9STRA|nr:unnamed protein product [Peronospora farinosa]